MSDPFAGGGSIPEPTVPLPVSATPPGWYPWGGGLRYWDGQRWTEHQQPVPLQLSPEQHGYGIAQRPAYGYPVVLNDARINAVEVTFAWIFAVLTLGYMLPWAVAATRGKSNSWAVGLVNVLLGWTLIGWIVALVMACMAHQVAAIRTY